MEKYVLAVSLVFAACVYAANDRFLLVDKEFEEHQVVLRYDKWTQELCTLSNTWLTRKYQGKIIKKEDGKYTIQGNDYLELLCEQPAWSIKYDRLNSALNKQYSN